MSDIPMTSRFKLGTRACFQPNLRLIDGRTGKTDPAAAAPCEIIGVGFSSGKVYYDIDVIYVETFDGKDTEFTTELRRIPSDMIAEATDE
jgi:hypothetical protein